MQQASEQSFYPTCGFLWHRHSSWDLLGGLIVFITIKEMLNQVEQILITE